MDEVVKTYPTARFFVVAGYYSLEELHDIVRAAEEQNAAHAQLLERSLAKTGDSNG